MSRAAWRDGLTLAGLALLFVSVWWFVAHAVTRGGLALSGESLAQGRFAGHWASEIAIFTHMVLGGIITGLAVLQWAGPVRRRWPMIHRLSGRVLAVLALVTGLTGLTYIALRGTIGGPQMSAGFAIYGVLMVIAALQTPRMAIAGQYDRHFRWGIRLILLCLASWLYRVHYGVFYALMCPESAFACLPYTTPEFTGIFDRIQNWAFFLPYLALAEIWFRFGPRPRLPTGHRPGL